MLESSRDDDHSPSVGAAPLLTISEAARRSGVPAITIRAWEQRYGIPRPARTPAGYRLYSASDLRDIAALKTYNGYGVAIRQAAFLVARRRTLAGNAASRVTQWRRRLETACIQFDDTAAGEVVAQAGTKLTTSELLREVVFPVVATMGEGRDSGVISISQEHFASELARQLVARRESIDGAAGGGIVLTGCAPEEHHELGLLSVVCQLREAGHRVVHLGSNVPVDAYLSTIDVLAPRIAIVAVTIGRHLRSWRARRSAVAARARRGVRFVWAGPGAHTAAPDLPGLVSNSIDEVVAVANANRERLSRAAQRSSNNTGTSRQPRPRIRRLSKPRRRTH